MKNARATMVSLGLLTTASIPYWIMIAMLLSERLSTLFFSVTVYLAASLAVAWTCGDTIHRWWLSGYDHGDSIQKLAKSPVSIYRNPIERNFDTIESKNVNEKARGQTIETPSQTIENTIEKPSKDQLDALKKALGLEIGCLQFKANVGKVYHVVYDPEVKRQRWKTLGTWEELKTHIS